MDNFDLKKFLVENKMTRNSRLNKNQLLLENLTPEEWTNIGQGFTVEEFMGDTYFRTPQGFQFDLEPDGSQLSAEVQYDDYATEEDADSLVEELENQLRARQINLKVVSSSQGYMLYITD